MDLRAEKENQRGALIKLRELSSADKEFADKYDALVIKGLGLSPPVLSRLEMQASLHEIGRWFPYAVYREKVGLFGLKSKFYPYVTRTLSIIYPQITHPTLSQHFPRIFHTNCQ